MKIGILTYHFANNYGAMLQAFSLQAILKQLGADVEFINFQSISQMSNNSILGKVKTIKDFSRNLIRIPHYAKIKIRISKFDTFRISHIKESKLFSVQTETFEYINSHYDAVIVGSDQVWNPYTFDFDSIYFEVSKVKIPTYVYAASLGTAKEKEIYKYKDYLPLFSAISVREKSSTLILKNIVPTLSVENVLDPTFLPDASIFRKITATTPKNKKYVLCYYLGRKDALRFRNVAKKLAKQFGFEIYFINANYGLTSFLPNLINDCGIEEFLGYLYNAEFICTNSFHAVALSIQLKIPFFSFEKTESSDNRKKDLLKELNLENRIIQDFDITHITDYKLREINDFTLKKLKEKSMSFLLKIFSEIKK